MKRHYRLTLCLIGLLAFNHPIDAKRGSAGGSFGGGGSSFNRGSSGARQQVVGGSGSAASLRGSSSAKTSAVNPPSGARSNVYSKSSAINSNRPSGFQTGGNSFQGNQGGFNSRNGFNNGGFNTGGVRPVGGVNTGGGFRNSAPGFHNTGFSSNVGPGSASRASGFRNALLGAAVGAGAGILLYEGTKAIIQHNSAPFHYSGRDYYWGDQYIRNGPNQFTCRRPLNEVAEAAAQTTTPAPASTPAPSAADPNATATPLGSPVAADNTFKNIQFQDGTRPKDIVWSCTSGREVCCGLDCCPAPVNNNMQTNSQKTSSGISTATAIILGVVLAVALGICCCCCLSFLMCPHAFDSMRGNNQSGQQAQYQSPKFDDQPQNYPMQPYGNQGYAQQNYSQPGYYPNQGPSYPQQYPPNPTY